MKKSLNLNRSSKILSNRDIKLIIERVVELKSIQEAYKKGRSMHQKLLKDFPEDKIIFLIFSTLHCLL